MRAGVIGIGIIAVCGALGGIACSVKSCTEIGCGISGFTATARRADGSFPGGTHRIEIVADGVTLMCTFTFAETSPGIGRASPECPSGLIVAIGNAETCTETRTGDSVSFRCEPLPGQFVETITMLGTPAQVHAWQYVDDVAILDAAVAPMYADTRPNGPECEPVCHQASASWTLQ